LPLCFVSLHLKYENTPALGFRAAAALAPLEKSGETHRGSTYPGCHPDAGDYRRARSAVHCPERAVYNSPG
ncbi:MAG: hypothetical protein KGZ25_01060, partial [Planctomycetes bacterium]|nr:hypothetical protein [Planctomycetota bacterium]